MFYGDNKNIENNFDICSQVVYLYMLCCQDKYWRNIYLYYFYIVFFFSMMYSCSGIFFLYLYMIYYFDMDVVIGIC